MPTRRDVLAAPLLWLPARAATRKTNVVLFMSDDHGAWANGCYGCPDIRTPNIDSLAAGGVRFTSAYACTPVCSPSRATYLTGEIPSQHGVQDWLVPADSYGPTTTRYLDGHTTYSELLARQGYTLGMCGKWHMGDDDHAQRGFTWWHTVPGGGGTYRDPEFVTNGVRHKTTGFKTNLVTDGALEFLDTVKDKPFFLQVPFYAPHTPFDYQPEEFRRLYTGSTFPCFPDDADASESEPGPRADARESRRQTRLLGADHRRWTTISAACCSGWKRCGFARIRWLSSPPIRAGMPGITACGAKAMARGR